VKEIEDRMEATNSLAQMEEKEGQKKKPSSLPPAIERTVFPALWLLSCPHTLLSPCCPSPNTLLQFLVWSQGHSMCCILGMAA
jgi:hypothetical protein